MRLALNDAFHPRAGTILPLLWNFHQECDSSVQRTITAGCDTYLEKFYWMSDPFT